MPVPSALLPVVLVVTASLASAQRSIFDSDVCFYDQECGPARHCAEPGPLGGLCRPRKPNGRACNTSHECVDMSFCKFDELNGTSHCAPQAVRGAVCSFESDACRPGLACEKAVCRDKRPAGRLATVCLGDNGCDQAGGFYCQTSRTDAPNKCARKLPPGATCGTGWDNFECRGFCKTGPDGSTGVCEAARPIGESCSSAEECVGAQLTSEVRDTVVCNREPRLERPGVCARLSQLKTRLGAPCVAQSDLCDAGRNLVCRWAADARRHVCVQHEASVGSFCKRGSALSRCDRGLECRVGRIVPASNYVGPVLSVRTTQCLARRRVVHAGGSCEREEDTCAGDSSCRAVPGVQLSGAYFRGGPPGAVYCVRTLRRGSRCSPSEKFLALCEDGFACAGGRCARKRPGNVEVTHANLGASCEHVPCAPGFACASRKICVRPE